MGSGIQPRLPGTLPSPKAAREALIRAKRALDEARRNLAVLVEARKVASEALEAAEDLRVDAATDFEGDDTAGAPIAATFREVEIS